MVGSAGRSVDPRRGRRPPPDRGPPGTGLNPREPPSGAPHRRSGARPARRAASRDARGRIASPHGVRPRSLDADLDSKLLTSIRSRFMRGVSIMPGTGLAVRVAASSLLWATLMTVGPASPATAADEAVRLDVGLAEGADPTAVIEALGDAVERDHRVAGMDAITVDVPAGRVDAALATLTATTGVRYAERGGVVEADGEMQPFGWHTEQVLQAWTWTKGEQSVKVAVVDTGVSPTEDLGADRLTPGHDVVDGDDDPTDGDGHGTLVAGLIGAQPDNGIGTAGVCPMCTIMPVRAMTGHQGTTADVAAGIVWAADHGARVINLSVSTATPSRLLEDAVGHAAAKGSLVVASAGNVGSTARRYPAAYDSVLAVSQAGTVKNTSTDQWVDASAYTTAALGLDGRISSLVGASGATATTAGVAALGFSMKRTATADEVRAAIRGTAPFPTTGTYAHQPRIVNAAQVVYDFGGTDTTAPKLVKPGLVEGKLIPARGVPAIAQATDDHGIQRIDYVIGGTVVTSTRLPGTQVQIRPPAGFNGPLPVTVVAYDYAGNADPITVTVQADTVAPTMTFKSPTATEPIHGSRATVTVAVPDNDIDYIYSVFQANGTFSTLTRVAGTNLWRGRVPVDSRSTIYLDAVDKAGNYTYLTRTLVADNDPPSGGSVGPAGGTKVRGTFTSTVAGVTDASGVAKAELWANGKYVGADKNAPYALTVRTGTYTGKVTLTWKVTDRWGQSRNLPARIVAADNKPPTVSITRAPKNGARVKGTVKVHVKATDGNGIARVELVVDGKVVAKDATAAYILSLNTKKRRKTMKVQVRAYDHLGNVATTATRTWHR
ncbi:S8 family serine peptidase [Actinoplanes sp. NPDC049548]|uniref:S8 family serine peptidase n=1 Tax=Actinoplanes sp. NPDC049548 TaxID=3155152 RepID=UPI0034129237